VVEPPLYCISTRFGPRLLIVSIAYCRPVNPTVTTRMIDADPMIMPSIVSKNRTLLARKLSIARRIVSENTMVLFAEFSVRSKLLVCVAGAIAAHLPLSHLVLTYPVLAY